MTNNAQEKIGTINFYRAVYILPTAMVRIQIGNLKTEPLRALCDSGSQPNLITHSVIKNYALRPEQVNFGLSGISGEMMKVKRKIRVKIFP